MQLSVYVRTMLFRLDIVTHLNYCSCSTSMSYFILWSIVSSWLLFNRWFRYINRLFNYSTIYNLSSSIGGLTTISFARIISLCSRANLLQTENDIVASIPTLTAFFTGIIDMSPEWHSWFLMFFSIFFCSLTEQTRSIHRLSSFRDFIVPPFAVDL